jgi:DNA-binding PadR family transcriptional regulator
MTDRNGVSRWLPLTETTFYVLLSLLKPLHGYGIMQRVKVISRNRIAIGPGTLYGALNTLLSEHLIFIVEQSALGTKRKTYAVTELGRALVGAELDRLNRVIGDAQALVQSD